jgi:hypothetical protein
MNRINSLRRNFRFNKVILINYFFVALLFLWFVYSILPLPAFQYTDGFWMWLPRLGFSAQEILRGHIPFWNEFQFCGIPLLADASTNILNPFTIFYFFLSPEWAYTVSIIGIFIFLILGTWKYFRMRKFSFTASMVATLGYSFGGQIIFWSLYHGLNLSLALFPWILFSFRKLEREREIRWQILAFFLNFLNFLGGFIQLAFLAAIAILVEGVKNFSFTELKKAFKYRFITLILAMLSASVIIIPTIETCMFSHRSLVSYYEGLFPGSFVLILMSFFGDAGNSHNYPNYYFYIGIILLALAIFYIRKNFKKIISYPLVLYALIFPFIIVALYFKILPQKFLFGIESDSWRGMFIFIFVLSLLAAMGVDYCLKKLREKNSLLLVPLELLTCASICIYLFFSLDGFLSNSLKNITFCMGTILLCGFVLPIIFKKNKLSVDLKVKLFSCWLITLMLINSFSSARNYLSTNVKHDYEKLRIKQWQEKDLSLEVLSNEGRVVSLSPNTIFDGLFEHWAPYYRIRSIGGYAAHVPRSIFIRMINDGFIFKDFHAGSHFRNNGILDTQILARYGVLYLIDEEHKENLKELGWKLIGNLSGIFLYSNPKYIGRAYVINDAKETIKQANIIVDKNSYLKISVNANAGDTLILADSWFPGWKCYDNGKEVLGFDANGFRGYKISTAGYHEVEWIYKPFSFFIGGIISIISIIFLLFSIVYRLARKPSLNEADGIYYKIENS